LWLKNDLSALDSSTPVVVVTHIPFVSAVEQFRSGGHAGWSPGGAVGNCDDALQILSDYNLKLVLQGHIHRDEQVRIDDISFIMPGAVCGAWWKGPRGGTQEGFGVIDVDCGTNEFSYHYLDYGWEPESR
ncbi:MAG: metallophosphoesterase, partial [Gemmatimonadota bacterium]|nr:metallophosphoesterase [Gemmatimonadota bacterium]